jgi:transglutaminase-like putative cysteine protease
MATVTTTLNPTINPTPLVRYRENVYFQDGTLLTAILATLLYLIVAISLHSAGHVRDMTLLIPVTLGATALALLMSFSRFDGFFALSHSMFTGLAWILYQMAGLVQPKEIESFLEFGIPELQAKVYFVLWKLLNWVDAALSGGASNDNYVFIFEIAFLVWWLTYLGIWAVFRYGHTWRAIVPAGVVLLINTYYAPKPVVGFLIVFCLLALLFLVRTNLAEQQLRWRDQRVHFNPDIAFDFLRSGFLYTLLVLGVAWLLPGLERNAQVRSLMAPINQQWEQLNQNIGDLYGGTVKQRSAESAAFGNSLTLGGERTVDGSPIFTVSTPHGRYWRAVTFDNFDGKRWVNSFKEETDFAANRTLPAPAWNNRMPITQTISLLAPMGNVLVAAPDIRQATVDFNGIGQSSPAASLTGSPLDNAAPNGVEIVFARAQETLEGGATYQIISHYAQVTREGLEGAGTAYPAAILERYLQLPEDFSPRVAQMAITVTVGAATPYAQAKAIETFLRTSYTYNDAIAAPPPNVDPVEYFLYDMREGYCDYYATAMVLMLRSLGVPARASSGYAEGMYDEESGLYFVTDRDAHTWVEVFFPNLGWIEFEPTAGESPLDRPNETLPDTGQLDGAMTPNAGNPDDLNNPLPPNQQDEFTQQQDELGGLGAGIGGSSRWWVWALLTPVLLVLGLIGLRRAQILGPTTFTPELPPILFERLQRWADRLGLRTRASDTPYEQARTFGHVLPEGQPYIQEITDTYVRYRFSPEAARMVEQSTAALDGAGLVQTWQQLQPVLLRAWGRKLLATLLRRNSGHFTLVKE